MRRKMMIVLIAMAFLCSTLLLIASCAKKQVLVSEPTTEVLEEVEIPVGEAVETEAELEERFRAEEAELEERLRAEEAERQERLLELERAQKFTDEVLVFESETIYFDFDKSVLKAECKAILKEKADWLLSNPSYLVPILIEGHCDERGTNEYNLALGVRRAHSAKKFLVALGVSDGRISTISYGEERPADPQHNEEAWAKNRRCEFRLIESE